MTDKELKRRAEAAALARRTAVEIAAALTPDDAWRLSMASAIWILDGLTDRQDIARILRELADDVEVGIARELN